MSRWSAFMWAISDRVAAMLFAILDRTACRWALIFPLLVLVPLEYFKSLPSGRMEYFLQPYLNVWSGWDAIGTMKCYGHIRIFKAFPPFTSM